MASTNFFRAFPKTTLGAVAFFLLFSVGHALTISPARMEMYGDPGKTITGEFVLINELSQTQTYYTSAQNFEAQGETGTPSFVDSTDGLASWISVQPEVTIQPGKQLKIPFSVHIPQDADAGGHFAAIFLSTIPSHGGAGSVAVGAKIGMLVLLKVSGDIKEGGGILNFDTKTKSKFATSLPITFVYRFNNSGNDRVNPHGDLLIKNIFGFEKAKLSGNPSQGNVLPGSTRRFEINWGPDNVDPANLGFFETAWHQVKYFAFGVYRATLSLGYGTNGVSENTLTLFVFPWQLFIIVLAILLVIYFSFSRGIKRYNRWIISQAQQAMHSIGRE